MLYAIDFVEQPDGTRIIIAKPVGHEQQATNEPQPVAPKQRFKFDVTMIGLIVGAIAGLFASINGGFAATLPSMLGAAMPLTLLGAGIGFVVDACRQ